jgi:hypothetical protein
LKAQKKCDFGDLKSKQISEKHRPPHPPTLQQVPSKLSIYLPAN